jgi:predicted RNase H-like nuclease (RuvC/YqgF family)
MKLFLFTLALIFSAVAHTQEIENLSKKELRELVISLQQKVDSLQLVSNKFKEKVDEKEQLNKELNAILTVTEKQLQILEFEKSSCKLVQDSLKQNLLNKEQEVSKLTDSLQKVESTSVPQLVCSYKEESIPDCDFPVRIKTCTFGKYKNIKAANPDFKGNYEFSYDLYKKIKDKYVFIKNGDLFNAQKMELLDKINGQIKQKFEEFLSSSQESDCFETANAPFVPFEDMAIHFTNEGIEFIVKFNVSFGCFSDQGTTILYNWKEILPYLNK